MCRSIMALLHPFLFLSPLSPYIVQFPGYLLHRPSVALTRTVMASSASRT